MRSFRICIYSVILLLTGCRADFDFKKNRLSSFGQDFVDIYGWPDSRQNWNTAIQYSVSVGVLSDGPWDVKIYSADPVANKDKSFLLGSYRIAADKKEITVLVDGPYTLNSICVGVENGSSCSMKTLKVGDSGDLKVLFEEEDLSIGSLPAVQKMSYFFAFEVVDSASTYLDYNDVVLEVVHVSGEETADVKLRAVGAKEEMSVVYSGENEDNLLFESVHAAFGFRKPNIVVNVGSGYHNYRNSIKYDGLYVGTSFSMVKDASRFKVFLKHKKEEIEFSMWPVAQEYLGVPPYAMLIANPKWDWVSEGNSLEERHKSFPYWASSYRLYNSWWDTIWEPRELMLLEDGSYRPDFDYRDMIYGIKDIESAGGAVPDISYKSLEPYINGKVGANISFVLTGREESSVKISFERSDGGVFELYNPENASVDVYGYDHNIDNGMGCYAEACYILLTKNTIKQIVDARASLRVIFETDENKAKINSVWIRER